MKKVNLRDLYPDVYKSDHFVEVTEDVLETLRAAERAEAAYDRRMYRYKAPGGFDMAVWPQFDVNGVMQSMEVTQDPWKQDRVNLFLGF